MDLSFKHVVLLVILVLLVYQILADLIAGKRAVERRKAAENVSLPFLTDTVVANDSETIAPSPSGYNFSCLDPRIQSEGVKWDPDLEVWKYPTQQEAVGCPGLQEPFRTRDELLGQLKGKHLLFVGDSTVRNQAQALLGMLCNPTYLDECGQTLHFGFERDQGGYGGLNCTRSALKDLNTSLLDQAESKKKSWFGEIVPNTCEADITYEEVELPGLTEKAFYRSKEERWLFWMRKTVPPVVVAKFRGGSAAGGVTLSVLVGGCMHSGNGLPRILGYLRGAITHQRKRKGEDGNSATQRQSSPLDAIPVLPKYDLLITSASFHCDMKDFLAHNPASRFYNVIPTLLRQFKADLDIPVLWSEVPHCLGKQVIAKEKGRNKIIPGCDAYIPFQSKLVESLQPDGPLNATTAIPIAPSFWITKHAVNVAQKGDHTTLLLTPEQWKLPCPFADSRHPNVGCYRAVVTALVKAATMVF